MSGEQRRHVRHLVKKMFSVEIAREGAPPRQACLHVHDISEGGMRLHTDASLAGEGPLILVFALEEPCRLRAEPVWGRQLVGGTRVVGLRFVASDAEEVARIREFVARCLSRTRRERFRLARRLLVEMFLGTSPQKLEAVTTDVSDRGMQILHEHPLPEEVEIPFRIQLEAGVPPIEVEARVAWQRQKLPRQYVVGLEFTRIPGESQERLQRYLREALEGPREMRILPPIEEG